MRKQRTRPASGRSPRRRGSPSRPSHPKAGAGSPGAAPRKKAAFYDPERAARLAEFFRAIADPTRQSILVMLDEGELSASEIVRRFHLSQSTISRHLGVLRSARLVKSRREGKRVIYRLECMSVSSCCEGFFARMSCCAPLFRASAKDRRGGGRCGQSSRGAREDGEQTC